MIGRWSVRQARAGQSRTDVLTGYQFTGNPALVFAGLAAGQLRESKNGPDGPKEHVACGVWRKRHGEDVTNDHPKEGVAPIDPTEATRSVNEVIDLRVQDSGLRFRERVCAPRVRRPSSESPCNLFLLVRSERRILGNVIKIGSEQLSLSLKFSP